MGKREKKREEPAPWLAAACQVLKGTLAATVLAVGALFLWSALISAGAVPDRLMERGIPACCVLGAFLGGLLAIRGHRKRALLLGLGAGGGLFLLLLTGGLVWFQQTAPSGIAMSVLPACLCGGALAGILGRERKKKRKR